MVFGGNGYVGSRVCQQGLAMGCGVVSINRSGRPRNLRGDWLDQVEWVQVRLGVIRCVWVLCEVCPRGELWVPMGVCLGACPCLR